MSHRCCLGDIEVDEDNEGYFLINIGRIYKHLHIEDLSLRIEYCPICGMKAKKSNLFTKYPIENFEDEKKLAIELMKFYTNRISKNDIDSEFFDFCFQNIENAIRYLRVYHGNNYK